MPLLNEKELFERSFIPEPNSGCWLWMRALREDGYGIFERCSTKRGAHRAAWQIYRGPIPDGLHVLHKCDVRLCVNPDHLWLGTNQDNIDDKMSKGRHAWSMRSHCNYGHPFDGVWGGRRRCRTCEAQYSREKRKRARQEKQL